MNERLMCIVTVKMFFVLSIRVFGNSEYRPVAMGQCPQILLCPEFVLNIK